jgi:acylphosphatase
MKTIRIEISGRVQGVNLRAMTKKFCDNLKIFGKVANKENGNVEVITQCSKEKIKELLDWLNSSPGFSKVENIKIEEMNVNEKFKDFEIVRKGNLIFDKLKGVKNLGKRAL